MLKILEMILSVWSREMREGLVVLINVLNEVMDALPHVESTRCGDVWKEPALVFIALFS